MKLPVVIAHRGASAKAPENTLSAFKMAMEDGAGGIELDVHMSRDGHLVVIHDESVNRTSNGHGLIRDKILEELKSLDFGSWFSHSFAGERIPTLEEVLELIVSWDGLLNVEIKNGPVFYPGIEEKLALTLRKFGRVRHSIVSSFNHYSLVEIRKQNPEIRTGILYMAGLYEPWEYARRVGACAIHPLFYNILPEIVRGCKENGIAINPFTVDPPEYIRKIALEGVDGIITNVTDTAVGIMKELEAAGT